MEHCIIILDLFLPPEIAIIAANKENRTAKRAIEGALDGLDGEIWDLRIIQSIRQKSSSIAKSSTHRHNSISMDTYGSSGFIGSGRPSTTVLTERSAYIARHPVTQTAELHSSDHCIAPVWPSITATPW
jgi:hypothetical protein